MRRPAGNEQFWRFWGLNAHTFKHAMLKFGVRVRTWDCLPHAKFCLKKSLKGIHPFGENLYQKIEIFETFSYSSTHCIPMLKFERT